MIREAVFHDRFPKIMSWEENHLPDRETVGKMLERYHSRFVRFRYKKHYLPVSNGGML